MKNNDKQREKQILIWKDFQCDKEFLEEWKYLNEIYQKYRMKKESNESVNLYRSWIKIKGIN